MKNKTTAIIQSIIAITFATILPAFNSNVFADCGQNHDQIADIVEVADHTGQFKTLLAAATAAGLVDTLKSEGPFTLFAPTDEAFAKLPEGTVEALLADIPKLKEILLYHVVGKKIMAGDVTKIKTAETANKKTLSISTNDATVYINNAKVTKADIKAENGVIHVIDSVLIPPKNIVEAAGHAGQFKTLLAAVKAAGLVDTLKSKGPFTLFAPTDEAFAKLPEGTVEALLADIPKLKEILLYHVVGKKIMAGDVTKIKTAETANKKTLSISTNDATVYINNAKVTIANIEAGNGVIHVINSVLIPPKNQSR